MRDVLEVPSFVNDSDLATDLFQAGEMRYRAIDRFRQEAHISKENSWWDWAWDWSAVRAFASDQPRTFVAKILPWDFTRGIHHFSNWSVIGVCGGMLASELGLMGLRPINITDHWAIAVFSLVTHALCLKSDVEQSAEFYEWMQSIVPIPPDDPLRSRLSAAWASRTAQQVFLHWPLRGQPEDHDV